MSAMHNVVAYVHERHGWAWCGWCRQWRSHGSLGSEPVVRPSGCGKERNEHCPTKGDVPVVVWPVPVRRAFGRYSGDGYFGGPLPKDAQSSENVPPVASARETMTPLHKACVRLAKVATQHGWRARLLSARGTWLVTGANGAVLRTRVVDSTVARFDRDGDAVVVSYVEGKFTFAYARSRGRLGARAIKPLLIEEG